MKSIHTRCPIYHSNKSHDQVHMIDPYQQLHSTNVFIAMTSPIFIVHACMVCFLLHVIILGGDDFKCPITCEVMRDPVVASGIDIAYHGGATC